MHTLRRNRGGERLNEQDSNDVIDFLRLKERMVAQLQMLEKIQALQIQTLEDVKKTTAHLAHIQLRHPTWKIAQENKELLKKAGVWTAVTYNSMNGMGLR
jgi:hypothetical protein